MGHIGMGHHTGERVVAVGSSWRGTGSCSHKGLAHQAGTAVGSDYTASDGPYPVACPAGPEADDGCSSCRLEDSGLRRRPRPKPVAEVQDDALHGGRRIATDVGDCIQ